MTVDDVIVIFLSLLFFRLSIHGVLLCSSRSLSELNQETDLFGLMTDAFLENVDRRWCNRWIPPLMLSACSLFLFPFISWEKVDHFGLLRLFFGGISAVVTWEAVTNDIDLATGKTLYLERILLLCSLIAILFYPGFLIIFLFIAVHRLRSWHNHQLMQLQILLMFTTYLAVLSMVKLICMLVLPLHAPYIGIEAPLFLILSLAGTPYARSGIGKIRLGKHWYSWAVENRLSDLVMSAYMWGWMRKGSKENRIFFSQWIKRFEKPLQFGVLLFECGWIFGGFNRHFTEMLCLGGALFHLMVLAISGLCFWQSICSNLLLYVLLVSLPDAVSTALFNSFSGVLFAGVQLFDLYAKPLWEHLAVAWWDTPFVAKLHWEAIGTSGTRYGLYNGFMRPHELFFGRQRSFVLSPYKMMTGQLGHVGCKQLRDALAASEGKLEKIDFLKELYGGLFKNHLHEKMHDTYLFRFFYNCNRGKLKNICPFWLRAPGNQLYSGILPAFQRQETVSSVMVIYREEFFNGEDVVIVREQVLKILLVAH